MKRPKKLPSEYIAEGWVRGREAVDANGQEVAPRDRKAVAWCADAAITAAFKGLRSKEALRVKDEFRDACDRELARRHAKKPMTSRHPDHTIPDPPNLVTFNDFVARTRQQVVALLRRIEKGFGWHES